MFSHPLTNKQALEEMNKHVYGHVNAKKVLINAINRSRIRWHQEFNLGMDDNLVDNKNVLLIGGSGSGKTFLIENLQKVCDFPLLSYSATDIVPSTHKGVNVAKITKDIRESCASWSSVSGGRFTQNEVMRQQVVFIDEIDKLALVSDSTGNWNKSLQGDLLQIINNKTEIKGVTFVFAGAFTTISRKESAHKTMGFTGTHKDSSKTDYDSEIVKAGLIPELMGRISAVVPLDVLSKEDYNKILNIHIIPKAIDNLSLLGITGFSIPEEEKHELINRAHASEQGVRMLHKEIQKLIEDLEFNFEDGFLSFFPYLNSVKGDKP